MKFIKRGARRTPKLSLILLDWSVRESFHLLHYLAQQTADRDSFEVIIVEYYSRISEALRPFADQVDTWVALEMPESCYYHKHLMYNVGVVLSRGEIVMIGDADAMVKPTFVERIVSGFRGNSGIVYHIDQFRNLRRDLYPFNFPSFETVEGPGCINVRNGKTTGVLDDEDPIHSRNYGACMCALRSDLIRIGGADEHIDYVGHICGPYDLTFRLCNLGHREVWDAEEFMYHTWHPGSAGVDNYLGPHDGRHVSTTALEALVSGRTAPLVENRAIKALRTGEAKSADEVLDLLIDPRAAQDWNIEALGRGDFSRFLPDRPVPLETYKGYRLMGQADRVIACPIDERSRGYDEANGSPVAAARTVDQVKRGIDAKLPRSAFIIEFCAKLYAYAGRVFDTIRYRAQLIPTNVPLVIKILMVCLLAIPGTLVGFLVFPRQVAAMIKSIVDDGRREAAGLTNVAIAIRQQVHLNRTRRVVAIVQGQRPSVFLRLLKLAGLLGAFEICRVQTGRDLAASLDRLGRSAPSDRLIVPSSLFTRFYTVALRHELADRMMLA